MIVTKRKSLYGKHDRNYAGFTFDEVGLTQETNGNPSDVVVKSKNQWFKLIDGSLEKTTEPELLQLQHSYNVPDSNLKFERDFFPYNGIYLARQDSGWGDRIALDVCSKDFIGVVQDFKPQLFTDKD